MEKVKVAWVSRHSPLPIQLKVLKDKLGVIEIFQVSKTFADAEDVLKTVKSLGVKYAVVVLPLSIIALLVEKGKDIVWLWAEMEKVHEHSCIPKECKDFNKDTDVILEAPNFNRHLRFKEFKRILKVEMVTEKF